MRARDIMTRDAETCTPDTSLPEVARIMANSDFGSIPVIEGSDSHLLGIVTDRDIVLRSIAKNKDPLEMQASDVMTRPVFTVGPDTDLNELCRLMEQHQVRRVP